MAEPKAAAGELPVTLACSSGAPAAYRGPGTVSPASRQLRACRACRALSAGARRSRVWGACPRGSFPLKFGGGRLALEFATMRVEGWAGASAGDCVGLRVWLLGRRFPGSFLNDACCSPVRKLTEEAKVCDRDGSHQILCTHTHTTLRHPSIKWTFHLIIHKDLSLLVSETESAQPQTPET